MKFDHLMHFLETARQQHLTKAASLLRLSPSAISYSIQCLEEELGVELFEKRGKRIYLTEAGRRLLKKIPEVQRSLSDLRSHVAMDGPAYQGHYRVGASHVLAERTVAPAVSQLFGGNAAVTLDLFSLRSAEVLQRVLDEQLDLGVCFSPQEHPRIQARELRTGQLKPYIAKGHDLTKSRDAWKRLSELPAALPKAFGGVDVCETHEVFKAHGIVPRGQVAFDHYGVGIAWVAEGQGWGFFPDWVERLPGFDLVGVPVPRTWKAPYRVSAVYLKDRFFDLGLERLMAAIQMRLQN